MGADWYYAQNNQQHGPISSGQLRSLAESGTLKPSDLVWKEGLADWEPAGKIQGLFPKAAPPPIPSGTATPSTPPSASSEKLSFGDWHQRKFGHLPGGVVACLWFIYGFIWIPVWYFSTEGKIDGSGSVSLTGKSNQPQAVGKGESLAFGDWYQRKLGYLPWGIQAVLWLFYGFFWIPLWYVGSNNSGEQTSKWTIWAYIPVINWIAWFHAGSKTKYKPYIVYGCLYAIPCLIYMYMDEVQPHAIPDWVMMGVVYSWFGGILHVSFAKKDVNTRIKYAEQGESQEQIEARIQAERAVAQPVTPAPPPVQSATPRATVDHDFAELPDDQEFEKADESRPAPRPRDDAGFKPVAKQHPIFNKQRMLMWGASVIGSIITGMIADYLREKYL